MMTDCRTTTTPFFGLPRRHHCVRTQLPSPRLQRIKYLPSVLKIGNKQSHLLRQEFHGMDADTIKRVRQDIKDCGNPHIHLNAAGDSPMPGCVLQKYQEVLTRESLVGGYVAASEYRDEFEQTRKAAARLINADAAEIALVDSATTAWLRAFYSVKLSPGDVVLTCLAEYAGNYVAMLQHTKRHGASIQCLENDSDGVVDVKKLESVVSKLGSRIKVICITHVPTNGGVINPVTNIGRVASDHNILYILDSCQAVGQLAIDVKQIGCDFLAATGRKYLRGPRGTGFLYARTEAMLEMGEDDSRRLQEPPTLDHYAAPIQHTEDGRISYAMHAKARRFEQWESNFAGLVALGTAIEYALQLGMGAIESRIVHLARKLRDHLNAIPDTKVMDLGSSSSQCGIVTFVVDGISPKAIKDHMHANHNVYIHTTSMLSSPLDGAKRILPSDGLVRASVTYFNTENEIECVAKSLRIFVEQKMGEE